MNDQKNIKILLVDDDRFLLDMYVLKFKASGIVVDSSTSTKDALEKIRKGNMYDVIVLDIIMPGMDGIQLLKTIREEKLCPQTSVIMLTNQSEEIELSRTLGVAGYIIKATSIPSEVVEKVLTIYNNRTQHGK